MKRTEKTLLNSVKSFYSLGLSTISIDKIIDIAKKCNSNTVALVDKNVMIGAYEFYDKAIKNNIKPVFGLEFNCTDKRFEDKNLSVIAYAKNDEGFINLCKISSIIMNSKEQNISFNKLKFLSNGLIIALTHNEDILSELIIERETSKLINIMKFVFDNINNVYIGNLGNYSRLDKMNNDLLKSVCKKLSVKSFAIHNVSCVNKNQILVLKTLQTMHNNNKEIIYEDSKFNNSYIHDINELELYFDLEDINNGFKLLENCNVEMKFKKASLPILTNSKYKDSKSFLIELCSKGLSKRQNKQNNSISKIYKDRLDYELEIICKMGFENYFLIIWDIINYSRKNDIAIGPGRGSAVGSLVAYCLGITQIDPIKYDLLFERFLNPERISMPDIDIDIQDDRRQEVVDYIIKKYGVKNTAKIMTINIYGKNVISDVGKTMHISSEIISIVSKEKRSNSIKELINSNIKIKTLIKTNNKVKEYLYVCSVIENLPKYFGTHTAGIVISNDSVGNYVPLMNTENGIVTQYPAEYLESLGLIKMDLLSLKFLTTIKNMEKSIKKINSNFSIDNIPVNDKDTLKIFSSVDTIGIFQLESEGMQNLLKDMQIQSFDDLVIAVSLYRPGPMENIPTYINARKNKLKLPYNNHLNKILEPTNGIIIYQEQVMEIAKVMASFSLGKADILRKSISKKNESLLNSLKKEFIEGAIKNGYTEKFANEMYAYIYKFAEYGFNKSHSVAYSFIAYQLAYVKSHYPLIYYCESLNNVINVKDRSRKIIQEALARGIKISKINFNYSSNKYYYHNNIIITPLQMKNGIGNNIANMIISDREKNGKYLSVENFAERMKLINLSSSKLGITSKQELTELIKL